MSSKKSYQPSILGYFSRGPGSSLPRSISSIPSSSSSHHSSDTQSSEIISNTIFSASSSQSQSQEAEKSHTVAGLEEEYKKSEQLPHRASSHTPIAPLSSKSNLIVNSKQDQSSKQSKQSDSSHKNSQKSDNSFSNVDELFSTYLPDHKREYHHTEEEEEEESIVLGKKRSRNQISQNCTESDFDETASKIEKSDTSKSSDTEEKDDWNPSPAKKRLLLFDSDGEEEIHQISTSKPSSSSSNTNIHQNQKEKVSSIIFSDSSSKVSTSKSLNSTLKTENVPVSNSSFNGTLSTSKNRSSDDSLSAYTNRSMVNSLRSQNRPDGSKSRVVRRVELNSNGQKLSKRVDSRSKSDEPNGHVFVIEVRLGDITGEDVDVIVNAANSYLAHGGGVAGAISSKGGPSIQKESDNWVKRNGQVGIGQVAVTGSGRLPAKCIVHTVGPVYHDGKQNEEKHLFDSVYNALAMANRLEWKSISCPAISSGIFGYPKNEVARVLFDAAIKFIKDHPNAKLTNIRFTNFDSPTVKYFADEFDERFS